MLTRKVLPVPHTLPPDRRKTLKSFARAAGSFVPKLAAKAFERYGFHSAEIMTEWPRIAGAELATFTAPERLKWPRGHAPEADTDTTAGATLVLRVNPARALDVQYRTAEIMDRINRYFGYRAISDIKLVQSVQPPPPAMTAPAPQSEVASPPLPAGTEPEIAAALHGLWTSLARDQIRR